jgi:hypothetical protein
MSEFDLILRGGTVVTATEVVNAEGLHVSRLAPFNVDRLAELADGGVVGFKAFMANSGIEDVAKPAGRLVKPLKE